MPKRSTQDEASQAKKPRVAADPPRHPEHRRPVVPYVRQMLTGYDLLRNPKYNKGTAFTKEERKALKLSGLLPPVFTTQDQQVTQALLAFRAVSDPLQKYKFMASLGDRHEQLFYRLLTENPAELMPVVYTPTVGLACQEFSKIYERPRGLYITLEDKGRVDEVLQNWPERNVRALCFTDGERILGLGDLGANGIGIPIGKMALYTACGGVPPSWLLPVCLDTGTNNKRLLQAVSYKGIRKPRDRTEAYDELIEEFVTAVMRRFGPTTLLQFEDFANRNAFRMLDKYRERCCTFNDDIQGTASMTLAGMYAAATATGTGLADMRFLFFGAGSAGIGIAELLAAAVAREKGVTLEVARENIFLVDSRGLIVKDRSSGGVSGQKLLYAHANEECADLAAIVNLVKPSAIIGVAAQPQVFTEAVCRAMAVINKQPVIFALSNPTSKAECTAEQAYKWTEGRALFASGSPFDPVTFEGKLHVPGQGNNSYIFPGLAMGILTCGASRVPDEMFLAAAKELASQVTSEAMEQGTLYPPLANIRDTSDRIAAKVAQVAYEMNLATVFPRPDDLLEMVRSFTYDYHYRSFILD